ncbi:TAXI family TRAP transporter solute-binding subunit [Mesorhizobium sp. Z1-4]|uniref:TAXI family TRAP transporter solute-binding subunit n=1 Tax=Mesorhizobium sp. Z1-4 TaxID=2448478 RepID=UPI000FD7A1B1|nr:TAXI family TRAP transporter solute-binding subunit [Mesorhizobium sp. Z1-4]
MNMMTKLGVAMVAVAACISGPANAQEDTHDIATFISGGPTGTWYPTAAMVSDIVNESYVGQPMTTVPGKGAVGNPLAVGSGAAQFGLSYGPFLKLAYEGGNEVYPDQGFGNLRAVANLVPNTVHLVIAEGVDMDILSKLKDGATVRIGVGQKGSSNFFAQEKILMEYGYDYDGLEAQGSSVMEGAQQGLADAFANRQIDIYTNTVGTNSADMQQAVAARNGRIMPLPENVRATLVEKWGYVPSVIPAGTYEGQDQDIPTVNLSTVILTTAEMDDEIVYRVVKALAENHDRMIEAYGGFSRWSPEEVHVGLPIPVHPGAERYFKERGWN